MEAKKLERFLTAMYQKHGLREDHSRICAWHTTLAEEWGVKTHGINLLKWYLEFIDFGSIQKNPEIRIEQKHENCVVVNAGRSHGQVATHRAATEVVRMLGDGAQAATAGIVEANHFGMGAAPVYQIAKAGHIGVLLSSTPPILAAPGSNERGVGSNPLAIAFPLGEGKEPLLLDMSLAVGALNRITVAQKEGVAIPDHCFLDEQARFTTDPAVTSRFKLASPLGGYLETSGYKGFGLAFFLEVMGACFLGERTSAELGKWDRATQGLAPESSLVVGVRLDLFAPAEKVIAKVRELMAFVKSRKHVDPEGEVLLPGEDRWRSKKRAATEGIALRPWQKEILEDIAKMKGIDLATV